MFPPCMRHRCSACATSRAVRLHAHRVSRSASCRAACCPLAMHRASASTAARKGADGALSPPHLLPRLGPLFPLVCRSAHQTTNGSRRHGCEAWKATRGTAMLLDPCLYSTVSAARKPPEKPRGTAMSLHPLSTVRWHPRGESDRRRSKGSGYKFGVTGGWRSRACEKSRYVRGPH